MTIREQVLEIVERNRERTFLVDAGSGRQISYGEFHRAACALAEHFREHGLTRGDRLAIMLPNSCELAVLYFASFYLGATIVPINPNLSASDVRFIVSSCHPRLVVTSPQLLERVAVGAGSVECVTVGSGEGAQSAQINISDLGDPGNFVPLQQASDEDLLVIVYTSGTTARPKGLAHKTARMFRNACALAAKQGIDSSSRFYLTLSMAYMGGFYNLLLLPFLHGSSVVVDHVFDARSSLTFWERASRYGCNTLWLAPTVMSILMKMDRGHTGEDFCRRSVRHTFVGFAPLPVKLKDDFEARYGVSVIENYGLSETLFVTARSRDGGSVTGYVGEALPGIELRIVGDDGAALPANRDGEIQVHTPDLMAGYLDEGGELKTADAAQWFSTGDYGCLDHNGSLFVTGRKKDLIIRGGVNISPAAIEEALLQVKGIADVAVVSVPHELYGEDIVAVLKLEPGVELEAILNAAMDHAKKELAAHQQPARFMTMDEFPRTANGKVQKAQLRELVVGKLQIGPGSMLRGKPADPAKT
jgi:long-chain acyl-CoA synthetase